RIGCTAFGGPAMLPHIRALAVDRRGWLSDADFRAGVGLAQMVPGATAMQVAAWVGLSARGVAGALAAYLGFGLPAFALMVLLSWLYVSARDLAPVLAAFAGLKVAVAALVLSAAVDFARRWLPGPRHWLAAGAAGLWMGLGGNPIWAILGACLLAARFFPDEPGPAPAPAAAGQGLGAVLRPLAVLLVLFAAGLGLLAWLDPPLARLCLVMVKIDCVALGGGYVSLPLMLFEVTHRLKLMSEAVFMDGIALGQVTPGPIVMSAAFVGWMAAGLSGAAAATVSVFAPSFFCISLASAFRARLTASAVARRVLAGSLASLVGLMAATGVQFVRAVPWGWPEALVGVAAFTALRFGVDVLWVVLGAGAASAVLF
ncbi:MAG: chromate efflux transporter, partial [Desulfovibrionaceae bacterium]